jgi:hypothetical protein
MNEQIKKLIEQATSRSHRSQGFGGEPTHIYPGTLDPEKFAELIIKECASICEINGNTYMYSFTPAKARLAESTSKYCGTMIKKHFGVEE